MQKNDFVKEIKTGLTGIVRKKFNGFLVVQFLSGSTIEAPEEFFELAVINFEFMGGI